MRNENINLTENSQSCKTRVGGNTVYKNYLIAIDMTGYASKQDLYSFFLDDGELYCGSGESIEDCKKQIDELNLTEIKDILESDFGWQNLDCEDKKWFVDELIKDVVFICSRS